MRLLLFLLSSLCLASLQDPTFTSSVALVRVDVQVLDGRRVVTGLTVDDFVVQDQGQPQPILYFSQQRDPLTLLLLLAVSGSMHRFIAQMAESTRQALGVLLPEDRVGVMLFSRNSEVRQPFTTDRAAIADAQEAHLLGSGTLINPALLAAAAKISREQTVPARRRAVLILTDNQGLNYQVPDEQVTRALLDADTVLNAIVVGRYGRPTPPRAGHAVNPDFTPADVFRIAEATGGEAVRGDHVDRLFPDMVERIRTRYSLQYRAPGGTAGSFRPIQVELSARARRRHPQAVVQARSGYYAR